MVYDGDELDLVCCFVSYYFIVKNIEEMEVI